MSSGRRGRAHAAAPRCLRRQSRRDPDPGLWRRLGPRQPAARAGAGPPPEEPGRHAEPPPRLTAERGEARASAGQGDEGGRGARPSGRAAEEREAEAKAKAKAKPERGRQRSGGGGRRGHGGGYRQLADPSEETSPRAREIQRLQVCQQPQQRQDQLRQKQVKRLFPGQTLRLQEEAQEETRLEGALGRLWFLVVFFSPHTLRV